MPLRMLVFWPRRAINRGLGMATQGLWGITRESNGELADPWSWPWFWRYPAGLLILLASLWVFVWIPEGYAEWVRFVLAGAGTLCAISLMYEVGLWVVLLGFGWLASSVVEPYLPGITFSPETKITILIVGVVVLAGWVASISEQCKNMQQANVHLQHRLNALEGNSYDGRTTGFADLDRRVYSLEDAAGVYDPEI